MLFQARHLLFHQKGLGFYHLSYYQEIIHAFSRFVDDPDELLQTRRRLGEALAMFEVITTRNDKKR